MLYVGDEHGAVGGWRGGQREPYTTRLVGRTADRSHHLERSVHSQHPAGVRVRNIGDAAPVRGDSTPLKEHERELGILMQFVHVKRVSWRQVLDEGRGVIFDDARGSRVGVRAGHGRTGVGTRAEREREKCPS
jgi:hypothetical protein